MIGLRKEICHRGRERWEGKGPGGGRGIVGGTHGESVGEGARGCGTQRKGRMGPREGRQGVRDTCRLEG